MPKRKIGVLFVCLGNICRSPTAEGVFRAQLARQGLSAGFLVDSAGTAGYHEGSPPDRRATQAARRRGVELGGIRARQLVVGDLARFDHVLCMDRSNLEDVRELAGDSVRARVGLLLEYGGLGEREVPDPYYGGDRGFELVLDLIENACEGLIAELRARTGAGS
jgi:protein-tyrosine phosphatase